jgi:type I restriction enzyme, S subunit
MPDALSTKAWPKITLADCAEEIAHRVDNPAESGFERFVGLEHIETGDTAIRSWGSTDDVTSSMKVFKAGDVIVARRNVYLRRAARAGFDGVCSGDGIVLRAKSEVCLPELLPFLLNTAGFWDYVTSQADGTMSKRITVERLLAYEFALPPIEEQRRITGALLAASRVVEAYSASERALERLEATYLSDVIGQLVRSCRSDALATLAEVQYGLTISSARRHAGLMRPYLRVANVGRGYLDLSEVKETGWLQGDEGNELHLHDVLFVEGHANAEEIGRAALWNGEIPGAMHQNHIIRARCRPGLDPRYLLAVVNAPHGRGYFRSRAKSSSGLNTINSSVVKEFAVPLASSKIQDEVVRVCAQTQEALKALRARREKATDIVSRLLADLQ